MNIDSITEIIQATGLIGFLVIGVGVIIYFFIFRGYGSLLEGYEDLVQDGREDRNKLANEYIKSIERLTSDYKYALGELVNRFEQSLGLIKENNQTQAQNDEEFRRILLKIEDILLQSKNIQEGNRELLVKLVSDGN